MPRTMREMVWAANGREYADWERTAELWAVFAEANRDHKKRARPFSASDLFRRPGKNRQPRGIRLTSESFRAMKQLFVKPRK